MKQSNLSSFFKRKINDDEDEGASKWAVGSYSSLQLNTTSTSNKHFKTVEQIHPDDIGHFLHGAVSDKIKTIQTLWTPPPSYTFPLFLKKKG